MSGTEVPMARTVKPMTDCGMPRLSPKMMAIHTMKNASGRNVHARGAASGREGGPAGEQGGKGGEGREGRAGRSSKGRRAATALGAPQAGSERRAAKTGEAASERRCGYLARAGGAHGAARMGRRVWGGAYGAARMGRRVWGGAYGAARMGRRVWGGAYGAAQMPRVWEHWERAAGGQVRMPRVWEHLQTAIQTMDMKKVT